MKVKLPSIVMVFVALALVLSSVAVAPIAVSAEGGTNSWVGQSLPSLGDWNLGPDTDTGPLALAADSTLFCGVYDASATRWGSPRGSVQWAVFYSTDGGYDWSLGWELPEDDAGPIVDIVATPGYTHPGTVYMVTPQYLYISSDGGRTFYRTSTVNPGVAAGGSITSLDVAVDATDTTKYVAVVGVAGGASDGVYTFNEGGVPIWFDKELGNAPAATNDLDTLEVMFSPGYSAASPGDLVIMAVAIIGGNTVHTVYSGTVGTWGIEILDAQIVAGAATYAVIDVADDFNITGNPTSFVGLGGSAQDNVYRIKSLPQASGPSSVINLRLPAAADVDIDSISVYGSGLTAECLVGLDHLNAGLPGRAQVYKGMGITLMPTWHQSFKPPAGVGMVFVVGNGDGARVSTGYWGTGTISGIFRLVESIGETMNWNGIGLLDEIVTSGTYLNRTYLNYAELVWEETSPSYGVDDTVYFVSWSDWWDELSLWRTTDNAVTWEMVLHEGIWTYVGPIFGFSDPWMDNYLNLGGDGAGSIWSVRTTPTFSIAGLDRTMFLLGHDGVNFRLYYSVDGGNAWLRVSAMPALVGTTYMHTGWEVFDNNTVFLGDDHGTIYRTEDRGNSWTDGVATHFEQDAYVTDIDVSPIYSDDGTSDQVVIAGIYWFWDSVAEVWISQDGAETDFEKVGTFPGYQWENEDVSPVMVDFDNRWGTEANRTIYAAASGLLDDWQYETETGKWLIFEHGDVGIYRTDVNLADPSASIWDELYGWDGLQEICDIQADIRDADNEGLRYIWFTELEIGPDNTIYAPYTVWDSPLDRFTYGGVLRCLDGTLDPTEWNNLVLGLPHWTGLYLVDAVAGSTHLISIGYRYDYWYSDLLDLRLMAYEDTLSGPGPAADADAPADGATAVGTIVGDTVSVPLSWAAASSTTYEWQVATSPDFSNPISGETTGTSITATGLEQGVKYYWRVRVIEPVMGKWSESRYFTTVTSGELIGPDLVYPTPGERGIPRDTAFVWTAVVWATGYDLAVWTSTETVISVTGLTGEAYQQDEQLDADTTFFWQVTAKSADNEVSSGESTFSTAVAVGAEQPTQAWVWVVIAISAVLLIAVLVLIIRTRRPA